MKIPSLPKLRLSSRHAVLAVLLATASPGAAAPGEGAAPSGGADIAYTLPRAAKVSLNILDEKGWIVRELLRADAEEAGAHTARWDGNDAMGRPVAPGHYRWKLLHTTGLEADYVLSVGNSGQPPYRTDDGKGSWGACHGNPQAVAADAMGLYLTWTIQEGNAVFAHTDYDGKALYKIDNGQGWGRNYDAALVDGVLYRLECGQIGSFIEKYDAKTGKHLDWDARGEAVSRGRLRIEKEARPLPDKKAPPLPDAKPVEYYDARALAANAEYVAASFPTLNKVALFRPTGEALPDLQVESPRGLLFLPDGRLLVAQPGKVVAVNLATREAAPLVASGLDSPWGIALSRDGKSLWITDQGQANRVKEFSLDGKPLRTLGTPGGMRQGKIDHDAFFNPRGIACGTDGNVYVTEDSSLRRVTRWSPDGRLLREWFGPVGPQRSCWPNAADFSEVYYQSPTGLIQCRVDLEKKTWFPTGWWDLPGPVSHGQPQVFESHGRKFLYFDNATLYAYDPAADRWPEVARFGLSADKKQAELWSAADGTADLPLDALQAKAGVNSVQVSFPAFDPATLAFTAVCRDEIVRFEPVRITDQGLPVYGFDKIRRLTAESGQGPDRWCEEKTYYVQGALPAPDGGVFSAYNGGRQGLLRAWDRATWNRFVKFGPDGRLQWEVGAHGRARKMGPNESEMFMRVAGTSHGVVYLTDVQGRFAAYTTDGLFVASLMDDNSPLTPNSLCVENVVGLVADDPKTHDGYLFSGSTEDARIWKLSGTDSFQRLEGGVELKTAAPGSSAEGDTAADGACRIAFAPSPPKAAADNINADGFLLEPEWKRAQEIPVVQDGVVRARFRLRCDDGYLWVAADVPEANPARNDAQDPETAFIHGDAVDLYLGADPEAAASRDAAGVGDLRILFYPKSPRRFDNGEIVLYRMKVAPDAPKHPFDFASPVGDVGADSVTVVEGRDTAVVGGKGPLCTFHRWNSGAGYTMEAKIPLAAIPELGAVPPAPAHKIAFDAGVIFANSAGNDRQERVYWHQCDARTQSVVDLPTEAQFHPRLWGTADIAAAP